MKTKKSEKSVAGNLDYIISRLNWFILDIGKLEYLMAVLKGIAKKIDEQNSCKELTAESQRERKNQK